MKDDGGPATKDEQDAMWARVADKVDASGLLDGTRPWELTVVAFCATDACRQVGFSKQVMLDMVESIYKGK